MPKPKQTKIGKVQALLRRPAGATLDTLMNVTGWQAHSVRAAVSTLRKSGIKVERRLPDGATQPPIILSITRARHDRAA